MEGEPGVVLNIKGHGEFVARRNNSSLFRFFGGLSMYNHVFLQGEGDTGAYIFRNAGAFDDLERYMVEHQYPIHDNQQEVPQCDLDAYERMLEKEMHDIQDW